MKSGNRLTDRKRDTLTNNYCTSVHYPSCIYMDMRVKRIFIQVVSFTDALEQLKHVQFSL